VVTPPRPSPRCWPPAAAARARQQILDDARAAVITVRHPRLPNPLKIQIKHWGSRFTQARDSCLARELWIKNEEAATRSLKRGRAPGRLRVTLHRLTCLCLRKHDTLLRCFDLGVDLH
jgi:hypothetical protein